MKNFYTTAFFILTLLFFSGCFIDDDEGFLNCEDGFGDIELETIDLPYFDEIELNGNGRIYIRQGEQFLVEIRGYENIIDLIDIDIDGDELEINFVRCIDPGSSPEIFITMPELDRLVVRGDGDIVSENVFVIDDLDLRISGSGEMDLAIEADDIDVNITGSGDIYLEGLADELDVNVTGSGDLEAFNLQATEGYVRIAGSGDVEIFVQEFLQVNINGSGNVYYKGFPSIDLDINGSGSLIDRN